jgi:hypothetical protein
MVFVRLLSEAIALTPIMEVGPTRNVGFWTWVAATLHPD